MSWSQKSQFLSGQITRNAHDWFGLQDAQKLQNPTTGEEETVGALLAELARQLSQHEEAPFTCDRLEELAALAPPIKKQYEAQHGPAYLRAAVQLAHVVSPAVVFTEFDDLLDRQTTFNIKLEPIEWANVRVPSPTKLTPDTPDDLSDKSAGPEPGEPEPKRSKLSEPPSSEN